MKARALAVLALSACSAPDPDPLAPLRALAGSWSGTHRVLGDEAAHAARYEIRAEADGSLVWEFRSAWGGGFEGRGVQRWDAGARRVVETWSDTLGGGEQRLVGDFDAAAGRLLMESEEADPRSGAVTRYRHATLLAAPDAWSYVMTMTPPGGDAREVVWIEMRREPAGAGG